MTSPLSEIGTVTIVRHPELTEQVRADIADIWHATTANGTPLEEDPPRTKHDSVNAADRALAAVERGDDHLWVAFDGPTVIGAVFLVANASRSEQHWMHVKAMMVRPSRQRGGVGSLLLEAAHRYAQVELRLDRLLLTVRRGTGAAEFYERHGYRVVGWLPRVTRTPSGDRDNWSMTREMQSDPDDAYPGLLQ